MHDPTQPGPRYHIPIRIAHSMLARAMSEAKELLPPAVTKAQWMASKHATSPWASVESWYVTQPESDPEISRTLCDLKLMAEALTGLACILTERKPIGSLKLAKQKRIEY